MGNETQWLLDSLQQCELMDPADYAPTELPKKKEKKEKKAKKKNGKVAKASGAGEGEADEAVPKP
jgi:hypothetical protein